MNSLIDQYEQTKTVLNEKQNTNQENKSGETSEPAIAAGSNANSEDAVDHPIEELRKGIQINLDSVNRPSYQISLRSRAEEDIVNDAKRKKMLLTMGEQQTDKDEKNCSRYSISRLKGLRSLNLSSCNRISDVSLKYAFNFIELRVLSLSKCQQISSIGIESMLPKCPSIEILILSECHNISDHAIDLITAQLKRLTFLHIERCSQLTDYSLDSIAVNCKRLKFLDVRGCRAINSEANSRLEHIRSLQRILMSKPGPYILSISKQPKAPPSPSSF